MTCPKISTYLLPKISLNPPAIENDTADATDHPPGIQTMFSISPRVCPMCARIPVTRRRPQEIAATYERPMNCIVSQFLILGLVTGRERRGTDREVGIGTYKNSHDSRRRYPLLRVIIRWR